jgi:cadmium resistance transport/sequestration family protein
MIKTIIAAMITYIATSIDEIPVLFMLYTKTGNRGKGKIITISYFVGTFLLISLGLLGAFSLKQIPQQWIIGLFGLVPFALGIKIIIIGEDEDEEKAVASSWKYKTLGVQVLAITLGLGTDDLGVYIPLFTTITGWEFVQMLLVFTIGTAVLCYISYQLTHIDRLTRFIEKYERLIIGTVFVVIGALVMAECGTIRKLISLL